ncbi:hypothetical protein D3C78_1160950 [compost metagenome]
MYLSHFAYAYTEARFYGVTLRADINQFNLLLDGLALTLKLNRYNISWFFFLQNSSQILESINGLPVHFYDFVTGLKISFGCDGLGQSDNKDVFGHHGILYPRMVISSHNRA